MDDLISRQTAIEAVEESRRLNHHQDGKEACAHEYEHRHFLKLLRDLPSAQPKELKVLADALDGCPLTYPCEELWPPEGWCMDHCKAGQQEPDAECWLKYAEVVANETD